MNKHIENTPEKILKDLDEIYHLALEQGNLGIALKVKELLGKQQGLFTPKQKPNSFQKNYISSLSTDVLKDFIKDLQANLVLDPLQGEG